MKPRRIPVATVMGLIARAHGIDVARFLEMTVVEFVEFARSRSRS